MSLQLLPRLLGAATALYSVAITLRPAVLARPCGLVHGPDEDEVAPAISTLIGGIGIRDAAIGAAMMLAPRGPALRAVIACRVIADAGDALVFGTQLPARDRRPKVVAFALFWAGLCAMSSRWAR